MVRLDLTEQPISEAKPSRPGRSLFKRLLKPGISAVLLILLLTQIDVGSVVDALTSARWSGLWAALALFILGLFIRAYRWQVFLDAQPPSDASDALAIAICQAHMGRLVGLGVGRRRTRRARWLAAPRSTRFPT